MGEPQPVRPQEGAGPRGAEARLGRGASEGQPPGASLWLTAGEAADAAGVTHRQLDAWIASEDLEFRTGWRGSAEIRLVSAADLNELAVDLDLGRVRESLETRGVFTGPRHMRLGSASVRLDARPADEDAAGIEAALAELPEVERDWARELTGEVIRLRGVIQTLREDQNQLERSLDERVEVVRTRRLGRWAQESVSALGTRAAAPPEPVRESDGHRHPRGGGLIAVGAGLALGWAAAFGLSQSGADVQASERVAAATTDTATDGDALLASPQRNSLAKLSAGAPVAALDGAPAARAPRGPSRAALVSDAMISAPSETSARQGKGAPELTGAVGAQVVQASAATRASDEGAAALRLSLPMDLAEVDSRAFSRANDVLSECAYAGLANGSDPRSSQLVVGPCYGGGETRLGAGRVRVPGTHRVGDVACCKHHAFVERMTKAHGDSEALESLGAEAQASLAEGFLPPLLRLRAERAAGRFLRHETGGWERAGLDGVAAALAEPEREHVWGFAQARPEAIDLRGPIRVRLESWVVAAPRAGGSGQPSGAGEAQLFSMTLTLQASERGDRLESFAWRNPR